MVTKLDLFSKEMSDAEKMYTKELKSFAKRFNVLGEMKIRKRPDIDTMDYIYSFEKLNGTSQEELDLIHDKLYRHMKEFSKENGIHNFYMHTVIYL